MWRSRRRRARIQSSLSHAENAIDRHRALFAAQHHFADAFGGKSAAQARMRRLAREDDAVLRSLGKLLAERLDPRARIRGVAEQAVFDMGAAAEAAGDQRSGMHADAHAGARQSRRAPFLV